MSSSDSDDYTSSDDDSKVVEPMPVCKNPGCNNFANGKPQGICNACARGETPTSAKRLQQGKNTEIYREQAKKLGAMLTSWHQIKNCPKCKHTFCSGIKHGNIWGYSGMSMDHDEMHLLDYEVKCGTLAPDKTQYLCCKCDTVTVNTNLVS